MQTIVVTSKGITFNNQILECKCEQCGRDLSNDLIAMFTSNKICKSCVNKNHKKATGR
jgi:hypothetical protein